MPPSLNFAPWTQKRSQLQNFISRKLMTRFSKKKVYAVILSYSNRPIQNWKKWSGTQRKKLKVWGYISYHHFRLSQGPQKPKPFVGGSLKFYINMLQFWSLFLPSCCLWKPISRKPFELQTSGWCQWLRQEKYFFL